MVARVLLVDDEPVLLTSLTPFLEDAGYQVQTAQNAEAALRALRESPPDAIVCDLRMPGIDGVEFFRLVRDNAEWRSIPFILLTGGLEEAPRQLGSELGIARTLRKPFNVEDLLALLDQDAWSR
jgi:DNA-binding response OmpR family regulator